MKRVLRDGCKVEMSIVDAFATRGGPSVQSSQQSVHAVLHALFVVFLSSLCDIRAHESPCRRVVERCIRSGGGGGALKFIIASRPLTLRQHLDVVPGHNGSAALYDHRLKGRRAEDRI